MKYLVKAPGRINLIGEHTDYNDGFVMPSAIDLHLTLDYSPNSTEKICAEAVDFGEKETFSLHPLTPVQKEPVWTDYIKGVCWAMQKEGYALSGGDMVITSNIPAGAGLSSSAALELAVAASLNEAHILGLSLKELALLCQKAENVYVGVRCGIMDQFAVALGRKDHGLLIDCRSQHFSHIPLETGEYIFLIVDSRVERSLAGSAYNRRREECREAAEAFNMLACRNIEALRDLTLDDIKTYGKFLPEKLYRRARFVVEENIRVLEAEKSLRNNDLISFGYFMKRSHAGLRDLFDVSCPELDLIVDSAVTQPGVLGARMTGAGFGGCAIILLHHNMVERIKEVIGSRFREFAWREPYYYPALAADGVTVNRL